MDIRPDRRLLYNPRDGDLGTNVSHSNNVRRASLLTMIVEGVAGPSCATADDGACKARVEQGAHDGTMDVRVLSAWNEVSVWYV